MTASLWRDPWLLLLVISRTLLTLIFMSYAACMPALIREWEMTATEAGIIAGSFHFGYLISLTVFSWMADRIGGRRVFVNSAVLSALTALAYGLFAQSYLSALVLFTLVALSQGGTYYPAIMLISERYRAERRGGAMGWLIASTSFGYALSLLLSGQMLAIGGYRLAFLVTGASTVLGAALAIIAVKTTPNVVHARGRDHNFRKELIRNRPAVRLVLGYTFHNWELLGMWAWMPAFLAAAITLQGTAAESAVTISAFLMAGFHIVGFLAASSMGHLSDRMGRRAVLMGLAGAAMTCSLTIGWMTAWPLVAIVAVGGIYAFCALGDSPVLSTALTEATPPAYLGSTLALRGVLGFSAGAVAPPVFGMILDATNPDLADATPAVWGWAFAVLGIGGLGALFAAAGMGRSGSKRSAQ